jgi:hypothetical protein
MRYAAGLGYGIEPWQLALAVEPYLERTGYFHDWEDVVRTALRAARERQDRVGEAHMLRSLAAARKAFEDRVQ